MLPAYRQRILAASFPAANFILASSASTISAKARSRVFAFISPALRSQLSPATGDSFFAFKIMVLKEQQTVVSRPLSSVTIISNGNASDWYTLREAFHKINTNMLYMCCI